MISTRRYRTVEFWIGFILIGFLLIASILSNVIAPFPLGSMDSQSLLAPSSTHLFGTDGLGRDVFSECLYATKRTLIVGCLVAAFSGIMGIVLGSVAGVYGKIIDTILTEIMNFFTIIPSIFIILMVAVSIELTTISFVIVLSFSFWTATARIMRSQVKKTLCEPYIDALFKMGVSRINIVILHIVPNSIKPVIANIALSVASACMLESGLSFIGVCGEKISLGQMINHGQKYILSAWWITLYPAAIILLICISVLLISDAISNH